jgi:hypothetical protein
MHIGGEVGICGTQEVCMRGAGLEDIELWAGGILSSAHGMRRV